MARKRVTLKDIAKEAGVSIATVSYVLSERKDQKISDAKRKKILQLANLYHYVKNPSASSLALGRRNLVSLLFPEASCLLEKANDFIVSERLSLAFLERGYQTAIEASKLMPTGHGSDAIIAFGFDKSRFQEVGDNIFVPLIAVDSIIDLWLFNEVNDDYDSLERGVLMSLPLRSSSYRDYLSSRFELRVVSDEAEAIDTARNNPGLYVRDPALMSLLQREGIAFRDIDAFRAAKLEGIVETTIASINEEGDSAHLKVK